mmetsp:Transcript_11052/g.26385  ORF Transcript_11052/g.26385 Transcript_11052/m.26385 type:complete len:310 (-) Transcript_11052:111-1040(-)
MGGRGQELGEERVLPADPVVQGASFTQNLDLLGHAPGRVLGHLPLILGGPELGERGLQLLLQGGVVLPCLSQVVGLGVRVLQGSVQLLVHVTDILHLFGLDPPLPVLLCHLSRLLPQHLDLTHRRSKLLRQLRYRPPIGVAGIPDGLLGHQHRHLLPQPIRLSSSFLKLIFVLPKQLLKVSLLHHPSQFSPQSHQIQLRVSQIEVLLRRRLPTLLVQLRCHRLDILQLGQRVAVCLHQLLVISSQNHDLALLDDLRPSELCDHLILVQPRRPHQVPIGDPPRAFVGPKPPVRHPAGRGPYRIPQPVGTG